MTSKRKEGDLEQILQEASSAHRAGRLGEAENGYRTVLREKPHWGPVLNALGTVFLDQAHPEKARRMFERAAELSPPYRPACYNLAMLKQQEKDHPGAIDMYRAMLEEEPDFGQAWNNLGVAYREVGDPDEALSCFRKAVAFAPDMAEAWNNLGVSQDEFQRMDNAAKSYRKAIALRPDYASAHFNLAVSLQKLGRYGEAEVHYRKVLEFKPGEEAATFMLHSLGGSSTPDAAPTEYVRRIFDRCAGTFEKILVEDLKYRTPKLLFDLVRPYLNEAMNVLDLGCGTGLGAEQYRPFASRLTGVDVSPKMVEQAAEKKVYDHLEVMDVLRDWPFREKFDLIYSSDVFVYFGNLDLIVGSIASNLAVGGIAAFSVERLANDREEYRLFPTGRYAHSPGYVQDRLGAHGFQLMETVKAEIRRESGSPVRGLLVVAKKRVPGDV
jgi:predicted TPR repeat methyltransferase